MALSLLCIGDIHLGRQPLHLPPALTEHGVNVAELTPVAAWTAAVDWATENHVDAVLMAGDVVEDDNRFFEAYGPLESGVRRLGEAGIQVFGVSGNHDTEVLPRLAKQIEAFTLLGAGGKWEWGDLKGADGTTVRLVGWSFPKRHVETDPMDLLEKTHPGELPTVGLLHCDLDVGGSRYAPVRKAELSSKGVDHWFLGHIHQPTLGVGPNLAGYLGTLVGLTPAEYGARGPWLVEISPNGDATASHLPLAPLRWERVDVDIGAISEPGQLDDALLKRFRGLDEDIADSLGSAKVVGCRFRFVGRSPIRREMRQWLAKQDLATLTCDIGGRIYFVERVDDNSRPDVDLQALARASDPPGLLAAKLLSLERLDDDGKSLISRALERLHHEAALPSFGALGASDLEEDEVRIQLLNSGMDALESLLAQKEGRS